MVLPAGRDLTCSHRTTRALSHPKKDCPEVLRMHWSVLDISDCKQLSTKRFGMLLWPLAGRVKGLQISTQRLNPQPGKVFCHIEPVRTDIPHSPQGPSRLRIDAPVPIRLIEQPVL